MTAVTTKTDPLALVERVQALLAQTDAPLAKLEEGLLEIERVMASNDADLFEIASRRKIEMTAATPAGELDKKLDALDKRKKEIERRTEIASIVRVELETRIATDREAERAAKRQANYDDALRRHVTATNLVREFLDKFGPECRRVLCEYAESESKSAAANQDLPCGAAPISSIESERKGALRSPKTTVRKFKAMSPACGASPNRALSRPRRRRTGGGASSFQAARPPAGTTSRAISSISSRCWTNGMQRPGPKISPNVFPFHRFMSANDHGGTPWMIIRLRLSRML